MFVLGEYCRVNKKTEIICFFSDSTCYEVVLLYFWRKGVDVIFFFFFFKEQSEGVFMVLGKS